MAFVYEPMGEKGVELINSLQLPVPNGCGFGLYSEEYPPWPSDGWVIDSEKDIYFFPMCGQGRVKIEQPPKYYCMIWGKTPIRIDVYDSGTGNYKVGVEERFEIVNILAPKELEWLSKEHLVETIKEAFVVYAHRKNIKVNSVEFPHIDQPRFVRAEWMWKIW